MGDLRICYAGLPNQATVTLLGQLGTNAVLTPGTYRNMLVYRLLPGDRHAAIGELKSEHRMWLWVGRLVGFLFMAIGLSMLLEPICVVLSIIPFVGRFFESLVEGAGIGMAFVLSAITILVVSLTSHLGVLIAAVGVAVLVMMFSGLLRSRPS
nr:TMEM43 family protein [Synechocystis sp. PCC 7509]